MSNGSIGCHHCTPWALGDSWISNLFKVSMPDLVTHLKRPIILDWWVVRCGSTNRDFLKIKEKQTCGLEEIGYVLQRC